MKPKQLLYHFIIAIIVAPLYAQDMEKDTIRLKEVKISNKKPKTITYRFRRGICTGHEYLKDSTERASFAYEMPKGRIKSLRFNFNNPFNRGDDQYYKDTEVELTFYEVRADSTPGNRIASKIFSVPATHRGKMDIDVYKLGVYNENGLYIALSRISNNLKDNEKVLEVNCFCSYNEKYATARRKGKSGEWTIAPAATYGMGPFELTVTLEQ